MDKLDLKILRILDWRGREQINHIAKIVHSNKDVVAYRVKKLEEKRIINRYFPILDMSKLGYYTSRLYLDLEEIAPVQEQELISFLDNDIHAGLIFRMDYPYRYGIVIWTKTIYDVENIIFTIKRKLGKQLVKYEHTIFCTYLLYPKDYLFGKTFHDTHYYLEPSSCVNYDEQDYLILRELAKDARISTIQIAQNLNIPQTTVSRKIKSLEEKRVILGYRAEINYIKLGYTNYFLEIYLNENKNIKDIESWAHTNKNVVWLQKIIGACDIEIEIEVKDRSELETFLNELRIKYPDIRKIIFWSQEYKKLTFIPQTPQ
jgi:DNA-binding Lrp family transcriptional regulator